MSDAQRTIRVVKELKKLGLRFRIDDFGTGHSSSLSYLRRFPMDTLKIDRSFVSNLDSDPQKPEIARTIAGVARNLGMDVVAEGTQALVEVNYLKSLDGEFAQGYYFSRPVDAKQATALCPNTEFSTSSQAPFREHGRFARRAKMTTRPRTGEGSTIMEVTAGSGGATTCEASVAALGTGSLRLHIKLQAFGAYKESIKMK